MLFLLRQIGVSLFVPQSDGYVCSVVSPLGGGAGGGKGSVPKYVAGEDTSHGIKNTA